MSNSAEAAPLLSTRTGRLSSILPLWQGVVLLLLIAWLYASILARLFLTWVGPSRDPNFGHGIFVPLFALFVLWQDRKRLQAIPTAPSWTGLPVVAVGLIMLVLGVLGAELFFSRTSLLIVVAGLIVLFHGWAFFRAVLFPWAFLFLMIPIPTLVMNQVTFPLQLMASRFATALLELVGVPVLRQGNLIVLAAKPLDVAEACSGIRSLLTLVTLAVIYGYLMESRNWVRVVLVCLAVPIAVVANSLRVFGTALLVQLGHPEMADGFFHTFQGLVIFGAALIMLFAVHRAIGLIWKSGPVVYPTAAYVQERPAAIGAKAGFLRFGMVAALLLATAIGLQAHSNSEVFPPRPLLSSLPAQIDGWTGTDQTIDQESLDILGHPEYLMRTYENASHPQAQPWIQLYIAYYPSQRTGDTIHSPNHCLPGAGWIPTSREVVQITSPDGSSFPANRFVGSFPGEGPELVLYWFLAHGREVASEYWAKYYLVADSIRMNRSDGALVRLMTPMYQGESPAAAQARAMKLGSHFLPLLDNYIPR